MTDREQDHVDEIREALTGRIRHTIVWLAIVYGVAMMLKGVVWLFAILYVQFMEPDSMLVKVADAIIVSPELEPRLREFEKSKLMKEDR